MGFADGWSCQGDNKAFGKFLMFRAYVFGVLANRTLDVEVCSLLKSKILLSQCRLCSPACPS